MLQDFRRLNVALTRAKSALVVLADVQALRYACRSIDGVRERDLYPANKRDLYLMKRGLLTLAHFSIDPTWDVAALCRDATERGVVLPAAGLRGMLS